jgi:hypothetical protein
MTLGTGDFISTGAEGDGAAVSADADGAAASRGVDAGEVAGAGDSVGDDEPSAGAP